MEKLLNTDIAQQVKEVFAENLLEPVKILFFGSESRCEYCEPARSLLEEITPLSDKISSSSYDVDLDPETAKKYRVDKTPGIVIASHRGGKTIDYGIRYAGMPSGHEFTSLINDIIMVSQGASGLTETSRAFLATVDQEILLQVFVTPT